MAERWLLIETFDGNREPTVIGVGSTPKRMVPLTSILGRGRYLDDVRAAVARIAAQGKPVRVATSDGRRLLVADPLATFTGHVHGAYVWIGAPGKEPPPRDPAGAWYFNLTTDKIGGSDDLLDLYGVDPQDRRTERVTAEAFGRLITNADESSSLALIVQSKPGAEHQATWTVRRDDGELRAANFALRAVAEVGDNGAPEVVLRGITHDIGAAESTPSAPPRLVLAQQVLDAEKEDGKYRAIVNLRKLTLLRWLDDPMPEVSWENNSEYPPGLHRADLSKAMRMSHELAGTSRVEETLRLRGVTGEWVPVNVSARLMLLDQHTTAALVTLSLPTSEKVDERRPKLPTQ